MVKKKAVGIQLLGKTKEGLVAILQVRSKWNPEKNAPESWPGICHATAFGGVEENETLIQALFREIKEELGEKIVPIIQHLHEAGQLIKLVNNDSPEREVVIYGGIIENDILKSLLEKEKNSSFGGFRIIHQNEVDKITNLQKFNRETGVTDENVIAMFPVGKQAVFLAFENFS